MVASTSEGRRIIARIVRTGDRMVHVEPYRLDPDRYPLKVRILARYADVDPLWHINNVAVAQYYEEARVSTTMMVMGGKRIPDARPASAS